MGILAATLGIFLQSGRVFLEWGSHSLALQEDASDQTLMSRLLQVHARLVRFFAAWPSPLIVLVLGLLLLIDTLIPVDLPLLLDELLIGVPVFALLDVLFARFYSPKRS